MISPPYIWFGGKRRVAPLIWSALGNPDNYIEPFFGGGAVMLMRPHTDPPCETVNDIDGFLCNFWRAVQYEPDAVAELVNYPVNEIDLEARHRWLCTQPGKAQFLERMKHDAKHYDVKRAAWWVWGLNAWIGSGWCDGNYFQVTEDVRTQLPHLGGAGKGECDRRLAVLVQWFRDIQHRFRNVRVCCGDWTRVVTNGVLSHGSIKGVFLDPPYSSERCDVYRCEDTSVAHAVRDWCIEYGPKPFMRIALCGYDGEHDDLEKLGWRVHAWKATGGFASFAENDESGTTQGKQNRHLERIWFSPHCINEQPNLL